MQKRSLKEQMLIEERDLPLLEAVVHIMVAVAVLSTSMCLTLGQNALLFLLL